jgi:hypothetical protein
MQENRLLNFPIDVVNQWPVQKRQGQEGEHENEPGAEHEHENEEWNGIEDTEDDGSQMSIGECTR